MKSSPFQRSSFQSTPNQAVRHKKKREAFATWFGIVAAVIMILCVVWITRNTLGLPQPLQALLFIQGEENDVFVPDNRTTREAARIRYRESLKALSDKNYDAALSSFQSLEPVYPGLLNLILLHEAEIHAERGQELAAQQALQKILANPRQDSGGPMLSLARYRLAQSHQRANETEKALAQFEQVRAKDPTSDYATGSLYYLAQAALNQGNSAEAAGLALDYLKACPDCRFSLELATLAEKALPTPDSEAHLLMGQGFFHGGQTEKALTHLKAAPPETAWLTLAKAHQQNKNKDAAGLVLLKGLPHARDFEEAQAGIDRLLQLTPASEKTYVLKQLDAASLPYGQDYILWQLAQADSGQKSRYLTSLVNQYPDSDYAPESSWQLLWQKLQAGQPQVFLQESDTFLSRYHYARSAPKVLFWRGKTLEAQNRTSEAQKAYQQAVSDYPGNYYGFRSKARLQALSGNGDPGWITSASQPYQTKPMDWGRLNILPASEQWSSEIRYQVAEELKQIGAADDLALYTEGALHELPPAVESWVAHVSGDPQRGIKVIRDAIEQRNWPNNQKKSLPVPDELHLLYPQYYAEDIERFSREHRIDPWITQALMREESYFNTKAISTSNAYGLMQLLPPTAAEVAQWEKLPFKPTDLFTPAVNIQLGTRYLAYLHERFHGNSMPSVGAYNGGPNAMARWVAASPFFTSDPDRFVESIPYEQSREYIKKVFGSYWNYRQLYGSPAY